MDKLVIFDLDGTLLNTISDLGHACNHALSSLNLPEHSVASYNKMVGNGLRKLVERAAPQTSSEIIDRLVALCRQYYDSHCLETTQPYPGIPELLETLNGMNVKLAVASNKYQSAVERIIRHFFPGIPFVSIQGQQEGRPIKPDPAIIESISEISGVDKDNTFMVGDSIVDVLTARNAGIKSIAVPWGFSPLSDILPSNPDFLISKPMEIFNLATG